MMRLVICTASRLPRLWIGQAFTAAPPAALRCSSSTLAGNTEDTSAESISAENTSADEFVKQVVGKSDSLGTKDGEGKKPSSKAVKKAKSGNAFRRVEAVQSRTKDKKAEKPSSVVFTKVWIGNEKAQSLDDGVEESSSIVDKPPPTQSKDTNSASPLVRRHDVRSPEPWKLPSKLWPGKPAAVFPHRGLLTLRGLPLETTLRDIVLAIDHAARHRKASRRAALTADIVIRPSLDKSTDVDAVVEFMHPDGAKHFQKLAMKGEFKVRGVVPTASLDDPKDPANVSQASEGDEVIAQLSKVDRAEYFASPQKRKVVRRTHLIYN